MSSLQETKDLEKYKTMNFHFRLSCFSLRQRLIRSCPSHPRSGEGLQRTLQGSNERLRPPYDSAHFRLRWAFSPVEKELGARREPDIYCTGARAPTVSAPTTTWSSLLKIYDSRVTKFIFPTFFLLANSTLLFSQVY